MWLLLFIVLACKNVRESSTGENNKNDAISISGNWTVNWSSLTYHNTYVIKQKGDDIEMYCLERSYYEFSHIHLTDNNLVFRITNTIDPDDLYVLDYNLFLNKQGDKLTGTVVTNHGVDDEIELVKL